MRNDPLSYSHKSRSVCFSAVKLRTSATSFFNALAPSLMNITYPRCLLLLTPELGKYIRKDDDASRSKDRKPFQHSERLGNPTCSLYVQPDREQSHGEKVVEQHEWVPNNACEEADGPVNAVSTDLEIAEAAKLEFFKVWI